VDSVFAAAGTGTSVGLNVGAGKTLAVAGTLTVTGSATVEFADGSAASPSITNDGDTNTGIFFPAADTIAFAEGGAEVARFDSAGNFGLGVTPSAWSAGYVGFQVKNASLASYTSGAYTWVGSNWYNNSGNKYIGTGFATLYEQTDGKHAWLTAASGTAGNAISFTQAMTLDASGGLGIGTTSITSGAGYKFLQVNGTTSGIIEILCNGTRVGGMYCDPTGSSGNGDFIIRNIQPGAVTFSTNSAEAARINSSGQLCVGATVTAASAKVGITTTSTSVALGMYTTGTGGTSGYIIRSGDDSLFRFQVFTNGDVQNTNNSYGAISDAKLKENIVDASPKLADLMQVKVRNYNLKADPNQKQIGVIAQELEAVFPSMINESQDTDKEGNDLGTTSKSVKYSVFVPMLIKAIQEQQALITTLTARITALESA
jgi:hypothetical protein